MMIEKGSPGYIKQQKKVSVFWLLLCILIAIAIFLVGYYLNHKTRANVFTVVAILMVLPAAKRVVALIVLFGKKGTEKKRQEEVCNALPDAVVKTDYVFTSTEKILHLDLLVVQNAHVYGVTAPSKQDKIYLKKYFSECVHKAGGKEAKLFDHDDELLSSLKAEKTDETQKKLDGSIWEYLRSLSV